MIKLLLKLFFSIFLILAVVSAYFMLSPDTAAALQERNEARIEEEKALRAEAEESRVRLEEKAREALEFCEKNGCNTDFCILVDMKIHSGKYRLFIYDFNRLEVERQALCAHGSGKDDAQSTAAQPLFSNAPGSWLTSLGKYKVGARSYSNWGINVHYKLHGLEESNSKAFERIIVLHSHSPIPSLEMYPYHLPMGWSQGCPVTDDKTMTYLDNKLGSIEIPALLWIYY